MSKSGTIGDSLADEIFAALSSFNDVDLLEQEIESVKAQEQDRLVFDLKDSFSVNRLVLRRCGTFSALIVSHAYELHKGHYESCCYEDQFERYEASESHSCTCVSLLLCVSPLFSNNINWYRYTATVFVM